MPAADAASITSLAKAKAKITPSPSPGWPPKGFVPSIDGNTFAKIPTAKELVGLASNDKALTRALARKIDGVPVCEKFACGAVQVASLTACTWWVISADVTDATSPKDKVFQIFGTVRTTIGPTKPKQYSTVLIVSREPIELKHSVGKIKAACRKDEPTEKVPSTTYTPTIAVTPEATS